MDVTTRQLSVAGTARLGLLLAFEIAAIVVLHRVGSLSMMAVDTGDLGRWLSETAPQDALVAVVRLVALVAAYWLLLSTALYVVAAATRIPALVRSISWCTLPGVRRIVDGALVLTIVGSSVIGSGGAALAQDASTAPRAAVEYVYTPQADDEIVRSGRDASSPQVSAPTTTTAEGTVTDYQYVPVPDDEAPEPPATTAPTTTAPTTTTQRPAPPTTQIAPPVAPETPPAPAPVVPAPPIDMGGVHLYTVVRGDNFWTISERHLESTLGRSASLDEVRTYWLRVIEENRDVIRSGNPNLIYPGEVFALPPVF